jgi:type VI secretion system protein
VAARGLFSRLSAADPARPLDDVQSILGNLRVILNTRTGDSPASPDFGIIDFCDLVHNFPDATTYIQKSIRDTLAKYEPRLKSVRVRQVPSEDPLKLVFEISARLSSDRRRGLVRVRTEVNPGGRVKVE